MLKTALADTPRAMQGALDTTSAGTIMSYDQQRRDHSCRGVLRETLLKLFRSIRDFGRRVDVTREGFKMTELSEDEEQSLDDALSTLDDLYEATLQPDGGFCSEQMEAIAKLAEEAMGCVLSVLDPEMFDAVHRDWGREARAVRTLTLLAETPQKLAGLGAALETADLLRRGLGLEAPAAHHEGTTLGTSGDDTPMDTNRQITA